MRVLVALDRTERAAEAARAIAAWAGDARPEGHLLHVLHPNDIPETPAPAGFSHALTPGGTYSGQTLDVREPLPRLAEDRSQALQRAIAESEDFLANIAQRFFPDVAASAHVEASEDTAATVIREAERLEVDFVAMSARARSTLGQKLFGSIHEEVVRKCSVPVLVVGPEVKA